MSSKPRFVGEKICLNQVIRSLPASKAVIKKKAATEYADGLYPAFSASGQDVWLPDYRYNCHGVVVSAVGARCGKAFKASGKWNVVANTHPLALDEERIDWDYAWRLLNNENWWIKSGSGQPFVKVRESLKRSIYLPPLSIQKQFAANLRGVESQISIAQRSLAALDSLVKSRFVEMFLNSSWPIATIGECSMDIHYGTSEKASTEGEYVYLRMNNMGDDGSLDLSDIKRITLEGKALSNCLVRKGDLLFNRTNSREKVGKTCVFCLDEPMVIAGYIIRVRLDDRVDSTYLAAYMNLSSTKALLRGMAKGAVHQANINAKQLASIEFPLADIKAQKEFVSFVSQVDKSRFIAQQQIEKLQMLYNSLAQDYFGD
jgi:restriction endonuclease S subunit